jgi:hypothetical protein
MGSGSNAVVEKVRPGDPAPEAGTGSSSNAEEVNSTGQGDGTATTDGTTGTSSSNALGGISVVTPDTPMDKTAAAAAPPANANAPADKAADGSAATLTDSKSQKESSSKKKGIKKLVPW